MAFFSTLSACGRVSKRFDAKNYPYDTVRQIKIPNNVFASKMA